MTSVRPRGAESPSPSWYRYGKKIEYILEDGQYNVEVAKKAFDRIMDQYNPMIMFRESTALGFAVALDIKDRHKIPYSSTCFSGKLAYTSRNLYVFVSGATYVDQVAMLLKYIAEVKPKSKVALVAARIWKAISSKWVFEPLSEWTDPY